MFGHSFHQIKRVKTQTEVPPLKTICLRFWKKNPFNVMFVFLAAEHVRLSDISLVWTRTGVPQGSVFGPVLFILQSFS